MHAHTVSRPAVVPSSHATQQVRGVVRLFGGGGYGLIGNLNNSLAIVSEVCVHTLHLILKHEWD